jgi:hypothetical protein
VSGNGLTFASPPDAFAADVFGYCVQGDVLSIFRRADLGRRPRLRYLHGVLRLDQAALTRDVGENTADVSLAVSRHITGLRPCPDKAETVVTCPILSPN